MRLRKIVKNVVEGHSADSGNEIDRNLAKTSFPVKGFAR